MTCAAVHPESGVACTVAGKHLDHSARIDGTLVYWEDAEPPVSSTPVEARTFVRDIARGERTRDEKIALAECGMDASWGDLAYRAVQEVAGQRAELTTDEVWEWLDQQGVSDRPVEPRALGVVMLRASRQGVIRKTAAFRDSERPECCRRPLRVWASCAFDDPGDG